MTRTTKITIILIIIVLALFTIVRISNDQQNKISDSETYKESYTFTTEDGWKGILTYTDKDKSTAILNIRNRDYNLTRAETGSGAKYESEDKTVSFWEHNDEATINATGLTYQVPTLTKAEIITMDIAAEKRDCTGVAPMECLVVNNELFYDNIKGFGFEEGVEYKIEVARTERDNPPADASRYEYELVKVMSATPVREKTNENELTETTIPLLRYSPEGTSWNYQDGTLTFSEGRYLMDFGCNNISGDFSTERTTLIFSEPVSTKKLCTDELNKKEQNFASLITQMTTFSETETGALLSGNEQEMILGKLDN
ncbi:MAG: DUF4377 domain-containing protein [Candidatus Paceibacterota bacterium]